MKKRLVAFGSLLVTLVLAFQLVAFVVPVSAAETIVVSQGSDGDYGTIQAAVDAAQPGDTIVVKKGIYYEDVTITKGGTEDKPITLRAESNGFRDVVITAADQDIREHKKTWTVVEGTDNEVWWVEYDRDVGSLGCNDLFMLYTQSLDQLITQSVNGTSFIGFPELGYYWDHLTNRLYIRLSPEYVSENGAEEGKPLVSTNPNDAGNIVMVGGECFDVSDVENPDQGSGSGGQMQGVNFKTDSYNIAVWIDGDAWVNIEGFTLEAGGTCGIYARGDHTTIRNCWFRDTRIGVKGGGSYLRELDWDKDPTGQTLFATSNVLVEYCDFSQYPFYTDTGRLLTNKDPNETAKDHHWAAKNKCVKFDYETVGFISGAGYNWEICYNYTYETFEPLSQRWKAIGYFERPNDPNYPDGQAWIDGSGHKVHHNRFERSIDNVIEFENRASDIEFYNNECIDVLQAVSFQPGESAYPFPYNLYIYNNLFYNTPEHEAVWGASRPFKLGAKKELFDSAWMISEGFWRENGTGTIINRHWFVDDKGIWIYNNTIVNPNTYPLANIGSWGNSGIFGETNLHFVNNLFYTKIYDGSGSEGSTMVGSIFKETYMLITASNMVIPGNTGIEFNYESMFMEEGYCYKTFEEAGLSLITADNGTRRIEITDASSIAVDGGVQIPFTTKDTTYVGALPYGETWNQNYGVQVRGDANFDGVVNAMDIMEISARMDTTRGDDDFVGNADLNYDGKLDNADIEIVNEILAGGES